MRPRILAFVFLAVVPALGAAGFQAQIQPPSSATARAFLDRYCVSCHTGNAAQGRLTLNDKDPGQVRQNTRVWERVVRRLKSGTEPPMSAGSPGPDPAERRQMVAWLESELDRGALQFTPAPGIHRLNRNEYRSVIRDLLALDIDPATLLPGDDSTHGFDNIAGALGMSSSLAEAINGAAAKISRMAIGVAGSDTPSRRLIFECRPSNGPAGSPDETACARRILTTLTTHAFRRPAPVDDVNTLMEIYLPTRRDTDFEGGIESALRRILTDPKFIYRAEPDPLNLAAGQSYRISDLELASRLSFFLWSSIPDDELLNLASQGRLRDPAVLEQQARRMLTDPRAEALSINFAGQWLNLRRLNAIDPFPELDVPLRQAMRREGELFFDSIVREDRSVLDLLTANYTFVNERLARHYGISGVSGGEFRRVALGPALDARRGLVGKAAILTTTSYLPERTSITFRGRWILSSLLGSTPPDPPPNAPPLPPSKPGDPNEPTLRQRMLEHTAYAPCLQCHRIMDPIGLALENFDRVGKWRTEDVGKPIDATAQLRDGTKIDGPEGVRNTLLQYSDQFVQVLVEKLLTYALGRGADYEDMPVIRSIARETAADNNKFSRIVVSIVKSAPFQMNTKE